IGLERFTGGRVDEPVTGTFVEAGTRDLRAETDVRANAVFVGAMIHVGEDLRLRRPFARPVGFLLERKAVAERRHVARRARIAVVAPRAAEPVCLLDDREAVDPRLLQM